MVFGTNTSQQKITAAVLAKSTLRPASGNNSKSLLISKFLETLKNDPETTNLPIVVVSADATTKQMEFILSKGADQYITKPINVGQLIKIFDQYLKYTTHE